MRWKISDTGLSLALGVYNRIPSRIEMRQYLSYRYHHCQETIIDLGHDKFVAFAEQGRLSSHRLYLTFFSMKLRSHQIQEERPQQDLHQIPCSDDFHFFAMINPFRREQLALVMDGG